MNNIIIKNKFLASLDVKSLYTISPLSKCNNETIIILQLPVYKMMKTYALCNRYFLNMFLLV